MIINCTNHPSQFWSNEQKQAATAYGDIVDIPFPQVPPSIDPDEIRSLVDDYAAKIEDKKPDAVLAAGEFTFLFMLVDRLLRDGIKVISSCSTRNTVEMTHSDGSVEKNAVFVFERFREYRYY